MKKVTQLVIPILAIVVVCSSAYAQFSKSGDAISYRKAAMHLIGVHFTRLAGMVKGEVPFDKAAFSKNAAVVKTLSELPWEAFVTVGSDKGDTTMKPSVLKEKDKFMAAAESFKAQAKKLSETADAGDTNAVKTQFGESVNACKGCHSVFRK
ncbi:MAG: hypothetical protein A2V65_12650 [Deltaproteobacteria bacterium RBG_13_49_15]|nr:MAG: hypothetical protein A2V65_12650 [Deltaproteobacteria bacterium RBG_13_49_15]